MAQNMQKRKDELFINIQQQGQLSIFDMGTFGTSSVEGETYTKDEIADKVRAHILTMPQKVGITKFLATFVNEYGLLCEFKMIYEILDELSNEGVIKVVRAPYKTQTGRKTTCWEEKKDQSVTIWRQ